MLQRQLLVRGLGANHCALVVLAVSETSQVKFSPCAVRGMAFADVGLEEVFAELGRRALVTFAEEGRPEELPLTAATSKCTCSGIAC